jgi:hypothetical protein
VWQIFNNGALGLHTHVGLQEQQPEKTFRRDTGRSRRWKRGMQRRSKTRCTCRFAIFHQPPWLAHFTHRCSSCASACALHRHTQIVPARMFSSTMKLHYERFYQVVLTCFNVVCNIYLSTRQLAVLPFRTPPHSLTTSCRPLHLAHSHHSLSLPFCLLYFYHTFGHFVYPASDRPG